MANETLMVAEALVRSGALKFGSFTLKSGVTSLYYIDLTWLLSSPEDFERVVNIVAEEIRRIRSETAVNKLASIELKGALLLPSIANKLKMPCVVMRKDSKKYGITDRIAGGKITKGDRILFFDDVVTSGGSKIEGIKPIERAGGKIELILVVVDREQGGKHQLEKQGYKVRSVTTISKLVESLQSSRRLPKAQAEKILQYVKGLTRSCSESP